MIINFKQVSGSISGSFEGSFTGSFSGSFIGITGSVTTSSFNNFSASYISASQSFDSRINSLMVTESKYLLTSSYQIDSASFNLQISNVYISESNYLLTASFLFESASFDIHVQNVFISESNYVLTSSYLTDSSSFLSTIANVYGSESNYLSTASYQIDSASFDLRINNVFASESNYLLRSVYETDSLSVDLRINDVFTSESKYVLTASYQLDSSSWNNKINDVYASESNYLLISSYLIDSASILNQINDVYISESNYVLTSSYLTDSASLLSQISNVYISESNYVLTSSYQIDSASLLSQINNVYISESNYLLTSSFLTQSASIDVHIQNVFVSESNYVLTSSYLADSASFDTRIINVIAGTGSFATTGSNIFIGNETITGSIYTTGSIFVTGTIDVFGNISLSRADSQININPSGSSTDSNAISFTAARFKIGTTILGSTFVGYIKTSDVGKPIVFQAGTGTIVELLRLSGNGNIIGSGSFISYTGFTGSLLGTASWAINAETSSVAPQYLLTSSYLTDSASLLASINNIILNTASFATTGSNTFYGNEVITGSVYITGGFNVNVTSSTSDVELGVTGTKGFVIRDIATPSNWFDVGKAAPGVIRFNTNGGYTLIAGASNIGARVHVGTLSTSSKGLSIQGILGQTGDLFLVDSNSGSLTNNGSTFIIKGDGKIGVGLTSPYTQFHIAHSSSLTSLAGEIAQYVFYVHNADTSSNNYSGIGFSDNGSGAISTYLATQYVDRTNHYGEFVFATRDINGFNEKVRIAKDGKLSITTKIGTANNQFKITDTSGSTNSVYIGAKWLTGWPGFGTNDAQNVSIITNNNVKLTVSASGEVGIGTTTPTEKLSVVGNVSASTFIGTLQGTSSWSNNSQTASVAPYYVLTSSYQTDSSSFNGRIVDLVSKTASYATTGSNTLYGIQTITGSSARLIIQQNDTTLYSLAGLFFKNLAITASANQQMFFALENDTAGGGNNGSFYLRHQDFSGSATSIDIIRYSLTGVGSSLTISSPTSITFGTTQGTNTNTYLMKLFSTRNVRLQDGGTFSDNGYRLQVSGALWVSDYINAASITSSLYGTASWSSNAQTASVAPQYLLTSSYQTDSASFDSRITNILVGSGFATTGSNIFIGNQTITGSFDVSGSGINRIVGTLRIAYPGNTTKYNDLSTDVNGYMTLGYVSIQNTIGSHNGYWGGIASLGFMVATGSGYFFSNVGNASSGTQDTGIYRKDIKTISIGNATVGDTSGNLILGGIAIGTSSLSSGLNLELSGSSRFVGLIRVTGSIEATSFTGSILGTSSWANNAQTASVAPQYLLTSSYQTDSASFDSRIRNGANALANLASQTASYATTGSNIFRGNQTITGSIFLNGNQLGVSSSVFGTGTNQNLQFLTQSFTSLFVKYTLYSGSNARAGQIISVWNGQNVAFNEVTTYDLGDTSGVSFNVYLTGSSIRMDNTVLSPSWNIKTSYELL